ncbi:MAG TPA: hypothetical protein VK738_21330 [Terriglobales bacterium]|nr:hypothetical protein [Terriglobales bacterium]
MCQPHGWGLLLGFFLHFFLGLGLFVLLLGIVKKAIEFAGFDIAVAAGADFADVSAAGGFGVNFSVLHIYFLLRINPTQVCRRCGIPDFGLVFESSNQ